MRSALRAVPFLLCFFSAPLVYGQAITGGGGSSFGTPPTTPPGVGFVACDIPAAGVAVNTFCRAGVTMSTQTLAVPYTVLVGDLGTAIKATNASAGTINVPDGGTAPFTQPSNFAVYSAGAGTVTLARTSTSQFCVGASACTNTQAVTSGQVAYLYLDAANNWVITLVSTSSSTPQQWSSSNAGCGGGTNNVGLVGYANSNGCTGLPVNIQSIMSASGTMHNLYVTTTVAIPSVSTEVFTLFKCPGGVSCAATTVTCTMAATQTTCNDTTHSSTYVAGDGYAWQETVTGTATGNAWSIGINIQ